MYQEDMLLLFLGGPIEKAVNDYYSKLLTENPMVYPYQVNVVKVERGGTVIDCTGRDGCCVHLTMYGMVEPLTERKQLVVLVIVTIRQGRTNSS
jgi:hypothetical protein